jgi:hypothetical protein
MLHFFDFSTSVQNPVPKSRSSRIFFRKYMLLIWLLTKKSTKRQEKWPNSLVQLIQPGLIFPEVKGFVDGKNTEAKCATKKR